MDNKINGWAIYENREETLDSNRQGMNYGPWFSQVLDSDESCHRAVVLLRRVNWGHGGTFPNMSRNAIVNVSEIVCYDIIKDMILSHNLLDDSVPCHFTSAVIAVANNWYKKEGESHKLIRYIWDGEQKSAIYYFLMDEEMKKAHIKNRNEDTEEEYREKKKRAKQVVWEYRRFGCKNGWKCWNGTWKKVGRCFIAKKKQEERENTRSKNER
ncbi:unnamed protein product [Timema podura]|uniref:Uncharacterized protein n=1 Tax=Timema podura TaxID=61482 RepID=A0ABN7NNB6_TIMPD|nr:unnamed protein product [Timema podura]